MKEPYRRRYRVLWSDLDANGHLRNTAFLDYAVETRFAYLADHGFTAADFASCAIGPVVLRDELLYRRELLYQEEFAVGIALAGLSDDGSRMRLHNRFYRADGSFAAAVTSDGIWFDLRQRRRLVPPDRLLYLLRGMEQDESYETLTGPPSMPEA